LGQKWIGNGSYIAFAVDTLMYEYSANLIEGGVMDFHAVGQGILEHYVEGLLIIGSGILFGLLKKYKEKWAGVAIYVVGGAFLCAGLIYFLTGNAILSSEPDPDITPANAEAQVKSWVSSFGDGYEDQPADPSSFNLRVTLHDGRILFISQTKADMNTIAVYGRYSPTPDEQKEYSKLSGRETKELSHNLRIEIARLGIDFGGISEPLGTFVIQNTLPVSHGTTSATLSDTLRSLDLASVVTGETLAKALEESEVHKN
jgi:hypothetical protein